MAIYKYPEFKKASKKHLIACECLIDSLNKGYCTQNKNHILTTIYYLSGYIFETILKFSLYSAVKFGKKDNIKNLDLRGLRYDENIKTHSLIKLKRDIETKNIVSLIEYESNKRLFSDWTSEIRYDEKTSFSETQIRSFF